jgi:chromatin assembly factor 1 subunit B
MIRQIAEHNHYVQGVAWDPLNEFVATQSSDRSVHIYNLKTKDGEFTLRQHNKVTKMDLPNRRISAGSPAPPDASLRAQASESNSQAPGSPAITPSVPGTPTSLALPMNPPSAITHSHSRRSSFGSSPSMRRSASPAPSMPLPAVRPMENSPVVAALNFKTSTIYANETYTSFFRRLTFTPEGSLLFTPAGQYRTSQPALMEGSKPTDEVINTVYIYTRAGFNKPPIAHLPGHKKPSIAVKCSPVVYNLRSGIKKTKAITIDTSAEEAIPPLPESMVSSAPSVGLGLSERPPSTGMEPPPTSMATMPSPKELARPTSSPRDPDANPDASNPPPAFALPYRVVYAVATQDAVLVYDTQQQVPLCVVSNLHFATFTDLTW